jgi:hypothetical protein
MSVPFPVIYNAKDNSNIKKYYQSNSASNIILENDILIKNMLQQNTSSVIINLDAQMYNGSNVVVENTTFAQNLSITDSNCCLSNPTAFCISSNFVQMPLTDEQSYTIVTGNNTFLNQSNAISAIIQLDVNNSPIFDTDLMITTTDGATHFNSVNGQWTVDFAANNKLMVQKAVNSGLNNQTSQSMLTIGEDINFNNNYALGKNQDSYYIQDATTNQLQINPISNAFLPATNDINITVDTTKITPLGLGSYKIYQLESDISISHSNNAISNHYIIGNNNDNNNNTNLSNVNALNNYLTLFNDTSENNYFKIGISNINSNSGLNFVDTINNTHFTIDNSTMVDNLLFMENIVYPNSNISLDFTQNDMTITPKVVPLEITSAYTANNTYFNLTANGEMLDVSRYNINGNIRLQIPSKINRTTVTSETPLVFPQKIVDYNSITNELKINKNVTYDVTNIICPTGTSQYNSLIDDNNSSLYMETIPYSTVTLVSNLSSNDDEIILIKISPLTTLTNSEGNNILYILDDITNALDEPIDAEISVQISGNISELKQNNDLRLRVYPKTLTQLNLVGTGDINGDNNLTTVETNLLGLHPTNGWVVGYADNVSTYTTSSLSVFTSLNTFPSLNDYTNISNNNSSLPVNISYTINMYNYEQITISYGINSFLITGTNLISNVNKQNIITTYANTGIIVTYAGKTYYQIGVTTTSTYNAIFQLNLAGFNNINMTTPQIYSMTISYIYYPTVSNLQNTLVSISSDKTIISVTQTDGTQVNNLSFIYSSYKTITTVYLNGLNNERTKTINTNVILTRASITPLNAQIQYRTKTGTNTYTNWANTGSIIHNIEPYFSTTPTVTNNTISNNYTITVSIFPSQNTLQFILPSYFTPLILDNLNTTSLASGYTYKIADLSGAMLTNFDPKTYINSNLIASNNVLNLDTIINYTQADAAEGNATYNATMTITNKDTLVTMATINITNPDFSAPIILAKINKNLFKVVKTVNTYVNTSYFWGDNAINNSSGNIDLLDGVSLTYENIQQTNFTNFSLNSDLIAEKLVGPITITPQQITVLTYTYPNCETLSIPYYRGYVTDDQTVTNTYDYVINRSNLTSYVINVTAGANTFISDIKTNIYVNSQYTISFNNGVNSIGTNATSLFSRLPATMLNNKKNIMPITISSDSVTITRNTLSGLTSTTKSLKEFKLYTFYNGEVLKSLNLRAINSNITDFFVLAYSKANTFVYYNSSYIGNPELLSDLEWGTAILDVDFATAQVGFNVDQSGLNNEGFLRIGISNNTQTNSITYFVIAEPHLLASQLDVNGVLQTPFDTTDSSVYDATKLITYYFPANTQTSIYNPFATFANLNNITFTATSIKTIADYAVSSKNIAPTNFIITGSNIQIQELSALGATTNGPASDGIIFSGLISDLIEIHSTNQYYNYINSSMSDVSQINLTYTQENKQYFQTVFNDTVVKPLNNIKFNINGYFIQDGSYQLVSSITKGIQTFIYDMIKQESSIILLKYECNNMDFTNIPNDTSIHQITFVPTKVYTSTVTMPAQQFGSRYLDTFNAITFENLDRNILVNAFDQFFLYGDNINWIEINQSTFPDLSDISTALLNNFSLSIRAVNEAGLHDIIELLYATSDIPVNFTVINQANAIEILATDGTPKFVITPFGQIITPSINVNAVTFFNALSNSNVDLITSNANIFNP